MKNEKDFFDNTAVPEIVSRKCNEAYEIIYKECEQKNKNRIEVSRYTAVSEKNKPEEVVFENCEQDNKGKKRIAIKRFGAIAACVAVLAGITIPAVSEYAPSIKSAFGIASEETDSIAPTEESIAKENILSLEDKRWEDSQCADIEIQNVCCDESRLAVYLALTPKDEQLKNLTGVQTKCTVKIDGKDVVEETEELYTGFTADVDGNYYTRLYYSYLDIREDSELQIHIYDIQGVNGLVQNWVDNDEISGAYMPETTEVLSGDFVFERKLTPDPGNNITYEVNETQNGITLESVVVTPFDTTVYISGLDYSIYDFTVKDQDGNELECYGALSDDYGEQFIGSVYNTPLKTATALYVEVFRLDQDDFPVDYVFEVPIEKGFDEKYIVEPDFGEPTLNPPLEEIESEYEIVLQEQYDEAMEKAVYEPVGTTIPLLYDNYLLNVRITGSEVGEISDYDIDSEYIQRYEDLCGGIDDAKLLLVTYEVENTINVEKDMYFCGFEMVSKNLRADSDWTVIPSDPEYISYTENGGKSLYKYTFAPYETKTIIYGYIVPESEIETGYCAFAVENEIGSGFMPEKLIDGTAKLYEIE